jgi:chromosome partitioning protein
MSNLKGTVTFWNYKGGVGKSTLSYNFAGCLHNRGSRVALLDKDRQGTAIAMKDTFNNSVFPVARISGELEDRENFDYFVVDQQPALEGKDITSRQDLIVIPIRPCWSDFHAAIQGVEKLNDDDNYVVIINQVDARSIEHKEVIELIREEFDKPLFVVPRRTVFERANNRGVSIFQVDSNFTGAKQCRTIIEHMTDFILNNL